MLVDVADDIAEARVRTNQQDRTEDLLGGDAHVVADVADQSRRDLARDGIG